MHEKYKTAMMELLEQADQQYADLIIDLAASRTKDGYCPELMEELGAFKTNLDVVFGPCLMLKALKGHSGGGDPTHTEGVSFGRTRR